VCPFHARLDDLKICFNRRANNTAKISSEFKEKEQSMYASIRRYKTDSSSEVARRVNEQFVARIGNVTGFLAYYVIDTGEGVLASISVFKTKEGADESNRVAAAWVAESLSGMLGLAEITAGEVVVHNAK